MLDGLRPAPAPFRPRRPRVPVLPVLACALLVVTAVAIFTLRGGGHGTAATTASTPTAAATASSSSPAARREAAVALAGLLAQSVTDRASVIQAVTDVRSCGMSLGQDARTFTGAANSRQTLLSRLGSMPGRPLLSAAMIQDLTNAWQASAQADRDLARWARDEASHRCTPRKSGSNANLQASYGPDTQAPTGKQACTRLWNPNASRYGL
ncbi:MAG TPA: hypothetical protein VF482_07500, partial [Trebonia sp.]